ncbi:MAG TPA: radical SAM protein [Blastocatellia bacterium]|nr:radical SAM protein [Blastocatellia bacterium]
MMRFNSILFNIVEQCNIRCRHCGYADSTREKECGDDELIDWVIQAVDYGFPQIIFTGGEPFLRFPLLKRGVEAVYLRGGSSGIFTNALWGKTLESARETLKQLPGLTHLYLSSDVYHLEFVPAQYILNVIAVARELSIPTVVICITYTSEEDKRDMTALFEGQGDYVNFHYGRVIPSPQVHRLVSDAYSCMHEFVPENFPSQCFLHTPLVNPNGTLSTCHIGKVETHFEITESPYYLGNLKEEKLRDIFARAEENSAYQLLRVYGPQALVKIALASEAGDRLRDEKFSCECHMCFMVMRNPEVVSELQKQACLAPVQNNIFLKRVLQLGDKV